MSRGGMGLGGRRRPGEEPLPQTHVHLADLTVSLALLQLINKGKGEALRIRAILRSLVPTSDLVGIISIPLKMPIVNKGKTPSPVTPNRMEVK